MCRFNTINHYYSKEITLLINEFKALPLMCGFYVNLHFKNVKKISVIYIIGITLIKYLMALKKYYQHLRYDNVKQLLQLRLFKEKIQPYVSQQQGYILRNVSLDDFSMGIPQCVFTLTQTVQLLLALYSIAYCAYATNVYRMLNKLVY